MRRKLEKKNHICTLCQTGLVRSILYFLQLIYNHRPHLVPTDIGALPSTRRRCIPVTLIFRVFLTLFELLLLLPQGVRERTSVRPYTTTLHTMPFHVTRFLPFAPAVYSQLRLSFPFLFFCFLSLENLVWVGLSFWPRRRFYFFLFLPDRWWCCDVVVLLLLAVCAFFKQVGLDFRNLFFRFYCYCVGSGFDDPYYKLESIQAKDG